MAFLLSGSRACRRARPGSRAGWCRPLPHWASSAARLVEGARHAVTVGAMRFRDPPDLSHRSDWDKTLRYMCLLAYEAVMHRHLADSDIAAMERLEEFEQRIERIPLLVKEYAVVAEFADAAMSVYAARPPHLRDLYLREEFGRADEDTEPVGMRVLALLERDHPDPAMVSVLRRALDWLQSLADGPGDSLDTITSSLSASVEDASSARRR